MGSIEACGENLLILGVSVKNLTIRFYLPLYVLKKLKKSSKFLLTPNIGVSNLREMAGEHSPDKACCACWIDRPLYGQLKKLAKQQHKTITDLVENWIFENVKNIELTPEDYREIAEQSERARSRVPFARSKKAAAKNGG